MTALLAQPAQAAPVSEEDPQGVVRLRGEHPLALQWVKEGDVEFAAGRYSAALALFDKAEAEAPATPLIERARCRTLSRLGYHEQALGACDAALVAGGQGIDRRAKITALLSGSSAPAPADAAEAYWLARRMTDAAPNEPWGYAGLCEIAERVGDPSLWSENLAQLTRVAPAHFETQAALQRVKRLQGAWHLRLLGWAVLLAVFLATAAHALLQRRVPRLDRAAP